MPEFKGKHFTLAVKAGTGLNDLHMVKVNSEEPLLIDSPEFTGRMVVRIQGFDGLTPDGSEPLLTTPYFDGTSRLFSVQIQGRFKRQWTADDIMWGNEFDTKLHLPTMAGAALKFIQHTIDPSLEADLHADKPWARSPLIATMNTVAIHNSPVESISPNSPAPLPEWPSLNAKHVVEETSAGIPQNHHMEVNERRKYFKEVSHRQGCIVSPNQVYDFDFYNPFLDFENMLIKFPAVHLSINMLKYYNGEPLRYSCKSRDHNTTFFLVQFELVETSSTSPHKA
jgi:hypothetical protein